MSHRARLHRILGATLAVALCLAAGSAMTSATAKTADAQMSTPWVVHDLVCENGCTPGCVGDCDGDGTVVVNELVKAVNVALGTADVSDCINADGNGDGEVTVDELVTAVRNALEGCPSTGALGKRLFSLSPESSSFSIVGFPFVLEGNGFTGYIEFEAGVPDPETGLAEVAITDASDYISMLLQPFAGAPMAICLRPLREEFPVANAGTLSCNGGYDFGFTVTQDHNIGVVGVDGFTEADCSEAGGTIEPEGGAHPGVCNGPISEGESGSDSGPGALLIAPDPDTLEGGLPALLGIEEALPCGDEGVEETPVPLGFTTGIARATILDRDNVEGDVLEVERQGENFSCADWTVEDGPGTLVLAAPVVDQDTGVIGFFDIANVFVFDD